VQEEFIVTLLERLGRWGFWGVALGMAAENALFPVPSELVLAFGGFLAAAGRISFAEALMAAQVGAVAGSSLIYAVGRWGGRQLLERVGRLVPAAQMERADRWFERWGELTVCLSRMVPGLRTWISLPAGMVGMPYERFVFYSFVGTLPWSTALVWAGYRLGQNWERAGQWLQRADLLGALAAGGAAGLLLWLWLRGRVRG
jgi:membrane protein DedA with SNARE-associated domain